MSAPPITERHLPHFHRRAPMKEPVRAATTANITISTALNNGDSLDGVTLATGDRVLVKDQSTGSQNGIYVVGTSPARDYDESTDDPSFGWLVYVREGTTNGGTLWANTNTSAPTIGTTALTFAQFTSGSGAPTTADYLVGTAQGGLSAEIVVGTTPGGELGGTWASPTVDATHAGSTHIALSSATPLAESGAGSAGTGTAASKDDHVHPAAGGSGTLTTIEEVDGSPTDSAVTKLVFPNGTLSITSHVATYTPTGGGGGPSDYVSGRSGTGQLVVPRFVFDPDIPPGSPNSDDQEFTSSLSGWTTRGTLDTQDANSTLADNLYLERTAGAVGINGIDRSFSSSRPKTIIAKFTAASAGQNHHNQFLYVTDGTKYMVYGPIGATTESLMERADWTNRTTRGGTNDTDNTPFRGAFMGPLWLRLILTTDTNIACAYSINGRTWITTSSGVNPSLTCSNYGFGLNDFGNSQKVQLYVDYVRFT